MEVFDEHQGGQLRIGAPGDPLELFPLSDAGIPDVGHVVSPAENELERRAAAPEFREVFVRGALRKVPLTRAELADRQRAHYVDGGPVVLHEIDALEGSLRRAPELTGEAFKACVLARNLVDDGALELLPGTLELLERERHYGRALDAHEAARAVRDDLERQREQDPATWMIAGDGFADGGTPYGDDELEHRIVADKASSPFFASDDYR